MTTDKSVEKGIESCKQHIFYPKVYSTKPYRDKNTPRIEMCLPVHIEKALKIAVQHAREEIARELEKLSKEMEEASYLSHEQRYKVSCRIDDIISKLKRNE